MDMPVSLSDFVPTKPVPENKWRKDDSGRWVMPEKQSLFLDWLLSDPKVPDTEKQWAEDHGLNVSTIRDWKNNIKFRSEWERRAQERNISVETTQDVIKTLKKAATRGDVQAAKFYMSYVEKFLPPRQVERDDSVAHLSDEELEAEIMSLITEESLLDG